MGRVVHFAVNLCLTAALVLHPAAVRAWWAEAGMNCGSLGESGCACCQHESANQVCGCCRTDSVTETASEESNDEPPQSTTQSKDDATASNSCCHSTDEAPVPSSLKSLDKPPALACRCVSTPTPIRAPAPRSQRYHSNDQTHGSIGLPASATPLRLTDNGHASLRSAISSRDRPAHITQVSFCVWRL